MASLAMVLLVKEGMDLAILRGVRTNVLAPIEVRNGESRKGGMWCAKTWRCGLRPCDVWRVEPSLAGRATTVAFPIKVGHGNVWSGLARRGQPCRWGDSETDRPTDQGGVCPGAARCCGVVLGRVRQGKPPRSQKRISGFDRGSVLSGLGW